MIIWPKLNLGIAPLLMAGVVSGNSPLTAATGADLVENRLVNNNAFLTVAHFCCVTLGRKVRKA